MSERATSSAARRAEREERRRSRAAPDAGGNEPAEHGSVGDLASDLLRRAASPTVLAAAAGAAAAARLTKGSPRQRADEDEPDEPEEHEDDTAATADADEPVDDAAESPEPEGVEEPGPTLADDGRAKLVRAARSYAETLTGRSADGVSAIGRVDGVWRLVVEIVEVPRIPSTTDVLASYELRLDDDCELIEYRRLRRYYRNVTADEDGP